jgi:beta-lactamase superfamily II metal-dependent hydrolase
MPRPAPARATRARKPAGHDHASAWTPAPGEVGIRVRMYRVGFGDFFLVTLLDGGHPLHVVIDCGVFKGTSQTGDIGSLEAAVADMAQTTDGRLALIVMTHRHADHIAGFARCAATFRTLTVGGVWMPIWESEYDPVASRFQAELTRTAQGLRRHLAALGASASEEQRTARKYMENAVGELAAPGAAATGSNEAALELLKRGLAGVTPRYYTGGDAAELPPALVDAGLSAQILGPPPVTDLDLMKLMDLKKGVGQYLTEADEDAGPFEPFGPEWVVEDAATPDQTRRDRYHPESFREWIRDPRKSWGRVPREQARRARDRMERALRQSQPIASLIAAKQLNAFLNNQSLVVMFTFKGKKLLFAGDAQAGNWEHWLFGTSTPDRTGGGTLTSAARQILTSLDLYKVGHHGSANATPIAAAEALDAPGRKLVALCSTEAGVYGTEDPDDPTKGTEVPRGPLLAKLASESALVRSDQIAITVDGKRIPATSPAPLPGAPAGSRLSQGPLWVDCYL